MWPNSYSFRSVSVKLSTPSSVAGNDGATNMRKMSSFCTCFLSASGRGPSHMTPFTRPHKVGGSGLVSIGLLSKTWWLGVEATPMSGFESGAMSTCVCRARELGHSRLETDRDAEAKFHVSSQPVELFETQKTPSRTAPFRSDVAPLSSL